MRIFYLFFATLFVVACGPKKYSEDDTVMLVTEHSLSPYDSIVSIKKVNLFDSFTAKSKIDQYEPINGELYSDFGLVGVFVDGKVKDGVHRMWYDSGQLKIEANYKNYKKDGLFQHWFESGQLYHQCYYVNGEFNGENKSWYSNGNKRHEGLIIGNTMVGEQTYYNIDGSIEKIDRWPNIE